MIFICLCVINYQIFVFVDYVNNLKLLNRLCDNIHQILSGLSNGFLFLEPEIADCVYRNCNEL